LEKGSPSYFTRDKTKIKGAKIKGTEKENEKRYLKTQWGGKKKKEVNEKGVKS